MSSPEIEIARQQWQAGTRRIEELRKDPRVYERLLAQVTTMTVELRRRVGQTFTMDQLVSAYRGAEAWGAQAVEAKDPEVGWERHVALVTDAAFSIYARGASDYQP